MKTEVYSWRVAAELKTGLEREAHRRKTSLAAVLDLAAREWLNKASSETGGDEEQLRLQRAASKAFGAFASGDPHRSESASQIVRQRLRRLRER